MKARFDLAVVGAGPAGAAAALGAARAGLEVALFEPQAAPDKPCGEGILPAGVAALRELGLEELLARGQALERIGYVLASGAELEIAFRSPGCALERPVLAAALERALAAEPRITRLSCRVNAERTEGGFALASGAEAWHARTLIAADGLQGASVDWLRRPRGAPRRIGVRARALASTPLARVEVHLGKESEVYLTPLPDGRVNVAVLRDGLPAGGHSSAELLEAALREHPRARAALGAWITDPEARALSRARPRTVAADGAFLAGDAAGGVDPVLGCGVAIALTTGLAAARAASEVLARGSGEPERDYRRFVRRETRLRRAVAAGLAFLAAHPRAQRGFARLLGAWPAGAQHLAARVAGG
jgi:flavin-dependent dehydrogenase